jgi:2-hydroxy-6-oxonona-2,4-dienedioate hydrolase
MERTEGSAMTSEAATGTAPTDARMARYRAAETRLWRAYGLDPVERHVRVGGSGARIRVQEVGSGEAILSVHGTGGSGAYFAPLLAALPGYRHLIVDRPGWVSSDPVDFCARAYGTIAAEMIRAVLDDASIDRVHLIGASIGDLWALRGALADPARVGRVVLLGGGPISPEIHVPPFIRLLRSPLGRVIVRLPERPGMFRRQLAGMGHGPSLAAGRIPEGFVDWHGVLTRETDWGRNERAMVRCIVDRRGFVDGLVPTMAELARLSAPVLMVVGALDPVGSPSIWQRFVTGLPAAELEVVPDAGHLVWLDDPVAVGRRIDRFLRDT